MELKGQDRLSSLSPFSVKSPVRVNGVVPFPMKRMSKDVEGGQVFV